MDTDTAFYPSQILRVEHCAKRLYAEVIQVADTRPLCWVRPLVLIDLGDLASASVWLEFEYSQPYKLYDLRQGSDLLLPAHLFQTALDTEVIPLLTQLAEFKPFPDGDRVAHQHLREFTLQLWRANPEAFQS